MNNSLLKATRDFLEDKIPATIYKYRWDALAYANSEELKARAFIEIPRMDPIPSSTGMRRFTSLVAIFLLAPTPDPETIKELEDSIDVLNTLRDPWGDALRAAVPSVIDVSEMAWVAANDAGLDRPALGGRSFTGTVAVTHGKC